MKRTKYNLFYYTGSTNEYTLYSDKQFTKTQADLLIKQQRKIGIIVVKRVAK